MTEDEANHFGHLGSVEDLTQHDLETMAEQHECAKGYLGWIDE